MKKLPSISKTQCTLLIFFCLFFLNTTFAQTKTYTGPNNGNWNTNANWSPIGVPTATNDVIIPSGKTVTISANSFAKSVSISGTLTINNGLRLTVNSDFTVNSGGSFIMPGGSGLATLLVYGHYTSNGTSDFWKSTIVIAGNFLSPSSSAIQSQGNVIVGGDIIGAFSLTGGNGSNQIYAVNPNATVTITPTSIDNNIIPGTQVTGTEAQTIIDLVNTVIYGFVSPCTFSSSTNNVSVCSGNAVLSVTSNASAPTYQWQVNKNDGLGWINISNDATYSGVTLINLTITNASIGMNLYIYRARVTSGSCTNYGNHGVLTVTASNTAGTASSTPTLCINTALTAITRTTTGATGIGTATGLPAGVTAAWASNIITISGTPTASGTFNYSIPLTGGCGVVNATGTITVTPANTSGTASSTPTLCINTALTSITRTTTGATGIGTATGLPAGVTAAWASNTITISGTPSALGTFNYSIPLTGGCGTVNATGTITVTPANTAGAASSTPTLCINNALTAITHTTTGATGIGTAAGLPAGVTALWASNTITISGTPTVAGTFNYSIPLTGGCGSPSAVGRIRVTANMIGVTASSTPALCISTPLVTITHSTIGATGIGLPAGLPAGVTATWSSNTISISGTPSASGIFNYSIPLTGGCGTVNATGTITVTPANTAGAASSTPTLCINNALTAITHTTTGATGIGTAAGLPAGVTATWSSNTISISGTPSASGIFNYSIPLTGGCGSVNATGTISVTAAPTTATNSSTQTMCSSTPAIVLSGNSPSVGIGAWSVLSGPSTLATQFSSNSSLAIFTPAGGVGAYVIRWSISNGSCTTSTADATVTVVSETVAGTLTGGSVICSGSTSGLLVLSGHTGTVARWESSVSPFSTWSPIENTATTYTSGNLSQETRFRAVVQNNSCSILNSAFTAVNVGNTTTWNGSSWSNGVPVSSTRAIVAGNYVSGTNGGNINACTLTVISGNVLITSGDTVSLYGAINVMAGSFTLENNANLIQSTNVSNSGNIIVKRNTPLLMRQDYILWSSPVANQQLLAFSPNTLVNRFYTYDASTDKYAPVAFPSTSNFGPGIGYLIRVPNTHPETPTIWGGQFTGVPNNGTINLTVANAKYYAIGNPYPSTINVNAFIAQNGITEALYFWRKTNNSNNSSYATYTTAGGVCNSGGDPLSLTPNGIIAVGQGFIVKTTNTNISFTNAMRVSNSNAPFLRTFDERNRIWLNLSSVSGAFYQTMVSYMPNATSGVDAAIDGRFLNDTQNALTSLINGQEYAIQGRALPFDGNDAVLIGFKAKIAENYTITLSNFDGLFSSNQSVFIKDNLTNTVHDLKSGPYTFASEAGTFNTRFEIVYQNNSLSTQTPTFHQNNVVVYKQGQGLVINSGKVQMSNVEIYDIRGRLLVFKNKINASEVKLYTGPTKQVLIVKITSHANVTVNKKIIN